MQQSPSVIMSTVGPRKINTDNLGELFQKHLQRLTAAVKEAKTEESQLKGRRIKRQLVCGELLRQAEDEGIKGKQQQELCRAAGLDYSTGRKALKVTKSPFLQQYEDKLALVEDLTVLHKITLIGKKKEEFISTFLSGEPQHITRAIMDEFFDKKPRTTAVPLFSVAPASNAHITDDQRERICHNFNVLKDLAGDVFQLKKSAEFEEWLRQYPNSIDRKSGDSHLHNNEVRK